MVQGGYEILEVGRLEKGGDRWMRKNGASVDD